MLFLSTHINIDDVHPPAELDLPPFMMSSDLNPELALLIDDGMQTADGAEWHALRTAPIITGDAFAELGPDLVPQRAVYGQVLSQHAAGFPLHPQAPQLYINTNAPFSGMLCGVQVSLT